MKKTLAIFLALIMILSVALVACKSKTTSSNTNEEEESNEFVLQNKNDTSDTTDTSTDTDDKGESTVFVDFTSTKKLWVMSDVNLRSEPKMDSGVNKVGVEAGTELEASAKNNDWYKITYNGETRYVSVDYVTENKADTQFIISENEADWFTLTIKASGVSTPNKINLRSKPVFADDVTYKTVTEEDVTTTNPLTVVGKNESGNWYIVTFKDEVYFLAITSVTKPVLVGLPSNSGGNFGG
ncbi:MAG: SH3 domain-containing protein [Clostridia bacterium]|nr:SH3 domain-containing protein [Clostridia bacterium]